MVHIPRVYFLLLYGLLGLTACQDGPAVMATDPALVDHATADTTDAGRCIRIAMEHVVSAPDSTLAALTQCWQAMEPSDRKRIWISYHKSVALAAYHASDMLTAMLHCDSVLNHGPVPVPRTQEAAIAVLQSRIFAWTGDFDAAATVLARALDLYRVAQDTAGIISFTSP